MSKTIQINVAPYLTAKNEVISLQSLGPLSAFTLSNAHPTGIPAGVITELSMTSMTMSTAISAGFESLVSVKASLENKFFLAEFIAWADPVDGPADSAIAKAYYGAGFRIGVKAWSSTNSVESNLFAVAAQSTLGIVSSSYEMQFFGIDLKHLGSVTPFVGNNVGNFDATAVKQLGSIASTVSADILKTGTSLQPALLKVDVKADHPALAYDQAANLCYALRCISEGRDIKTATTTMPAVPDGMAPLDKASIQDMYTIWGIRGESDPSKAQKKSASHYLFEEM